MMEMTDIWYYLEVALLMLLGVVMCDELNDRFKRTPFGPIRIPIIGNLHQLYWYDRKYVYKALTRLAYAHGNTMKVWFGLVGAVVISGYERINHVIRSDDWVGVHDDVWTLDRFEKRKSSRPATATENADSIRVWATVRMYAEQVLKEYGFGKHNTMDDVLKKNGEDVRNLIQPLNANSNGAIKVTKNFFLPYVLEINWAFVTGESISTEDSPILQQLLRLIKRWEELTIITSKYLDNWPTLLSYLPIKEEYEELRQVNTGIRNLLQEIIQEYRDKGDFKESPKNFIEKFLQKIEKIKENTESKDSGADEIVFSDKSLASVLFNILVPSSLVLQSSLNFSCYSLSLHPDVQEKLREEIGANSQEFSVSTFSKMPYFTAFLLEAYRLGNVVPLEKRKMLKTIREGDTRVTRGTTLVLNYHSSNVDKSTWNDPMAFNPSRFLDSENNVVDEHKLLALVAAKRLCIGELVAKPILIHSVNSLVSNFCFSSCSTEGSSTGLGQPQWGIINNPPTYHLKINQCFPTSEKLKFEE